MSRKSGCQNHDFTYDFVGGNRYNYMYAIDSIACYNNSRRKITMWNTPSYTEMRFGFEVTMYIANK